MEGPRVRLVARFEDGEALFVAVCDRGLEGVVAESVGSTTSTVNTFGSSLSIRSTTRRFGLVAAAVRVGGLLEPGRPLRDVSVPVNSHVLCDSGRSRENPARRTVGCDKRNAT